MANARRGVAKRRSVAPARQQRRRHISPRRLRRKAVAQKRVRFSNAVRVVHRGGRGSRGSRHGRGGHHLRCRSSVFNIPLIVPRHLQGVKFDTYIKKVQRKVKPKLALKRESVKLLDNLLRDTLHQIATHASSKMGRRKTLKPKIILKALRKVMPASLVRRVDAHAQGVLLRYSKTLKRRR